MCECDSGDFYGVYEDVQDVDGVCDSGDVHCVCDSQMHILCDSGMYMVCIYDYMGCIYIIKGVYDYGT